MNTSELVELLASREFSEVEVYNLLTADFHHEIPLELAVASAHLIRYFHYKISYVLVPVIDRLRAPIPDISKE